MAINNEATTAVEVRELGYWLIKMRLARTGLDVGEPWDDEYQAEAERLGCPDMFEFDDRNDYFGQLLNYGYEANMRGEITEAVLEAIREIHGEEFVASIISVKEITTQMGISLDQLHDIMKNVERLRDAEGLTREDGTYDIDVYLAFARKEYGEVDEGVMEVMSMMVAFNALLRGEEITHEDIDREVQAALIRTAH